MPEEKRTASALLDERFAEVKAATLTWAVTTVRAELLALGGDEPRARFRSRVEGEFSIHVTREQAREIGPFMYQQADISVRIERNEDDEIVRGKLLEFEPVETGDVEATIEAWDSYHREHASKWDSIVDVEKRWR